MKKSSSPTESRKKRRSENGDAVPPADPPKVEHRAGIPRLTRRVPPEAERRAFEDAINGWWWL